MKFGLDYAEARLSPVDLRTHRIDFVCRYISTPGNPKNLTLDELAGLRANGRGVAVVFETTGASWRGGRTAGVEDAKRAASQLVGLRLLGAPAYFALDEDVRPDELPTALAYIEGAVSVLGWARVGVYGSYAVVAYLAAKRACRYFWQTYAWSAGRWHKAAKLRQYRNSMSFLGASCDFDHAYALDYGQVDPPKHRRILNVVLRARLRAWILRERARGATWRWLKTTARWKLWRRLGGH